jgi:hypothetical protein
LRYHYHRKCEQRVLGSAVLAIEHRFRGLLGAAFDIGCFDEAQKSSRLGNTTICAKIILNAVLSASEHANFRYQQRLFDTKDDG